MNKPDDWKKLARLDALIAKCEARRAQIVWNLTEQCEAAGTYIMPKEFFPKQMH